MTNLTHEFLVRWREEALVVLAEWETVWIAAGKPGRPGSSKAEAVRKLFEGE